MKILLFLLYALLLGYYLYTQGNKWGGKSAARGVLALFVLKIGLAILYVILHVRWYGGTDVVNYFKKGMYIYDNLMPQRAYLYFRMVLGPNGTAPTPELAEMIEGVGSWYNTNAYTVIRLNAFLALFSRGYIYTHALFAAFVSTVGLFRFYIAWVENYPKLRNTFWIGGLLFPSVLFWTSGMHKEALSVFLLGNIFYLLQKTKAFSWQYAPQLFWLLLCLWGVYLVRNYYFLMLLPLVFAYFLARFSRLKKYKATYVFAAVVLVSFGLVSVLGNIFPSFNIFARIAYIQSLFLQYYNGNSDIFLSPMAPTWYGFIQGIPQAINNVLGFPTLDYGTNKLYWLFWGENIVLIFLSITAIVRRKKLLLQSTAIVCLSFCLAMAICLLIGLTIDNLGAIFRYRSIVLCLLFPVLMSFILYPQSKQNAN
ncbi:MAG: hypothetical protein R2798_08105 [Chitinophagales bacterium]|nr:hypothetical protein [Bacteroidota bacterium]MCB9042397.1 hypothetical protein [Chitinophagales bacterium]